MANPTLDGAIIDYAPAFVTLDGVIMDASIPFVTLDCVLLDFEGPAGITGTSPYDEMAAIFKAAVVQAIIAENSNSENAIQMRAIDSALGKTPTANDEKPVVVKAWLA